MKILIITSCFAPKNVIGAIRVSKIAKYLVRAGMELTVISPVLEDYELKDETLECPEFDKIIRITVPYGKFVSSMTRKYKTSTQQKSSSITTKKHSAKQFLRNLFDAYRDYDWSHRVLAKLKGMDEQYDVVLSSSPLTCSHDIAKYMKKSRRARVWLADFRDPIVQEAATSFELFQQKRKQSAILHYADLATIVTMDHAKNFYCNPEDKHKVHYLSNGFDEDDKHHLESICRESATDNLGKLVFSYTGGLYSGKRDCSPLFKALSELVSEGKVDVHNLQFDYAGRDFSILSSQASQYGLEGCLVNHGLISRTESIKLQYNSDFVIVATYCYKDNGGELTGKLYEPLMMDKLVCMLVNGTGKNSEPANFIKELNAGFVFEQSNHENDYPLLKQNILKAYTEKINIGSLSKKIDNQQLVKYTHKYLVDELLNLINSY